MKVRVHNPKHNLLECKDYEARPGPNRGFEIDIKDKKTGEFIATVWAGSTEAYMIPDEQPDPIS